MNLKFILVSLVAGWLIMVASGCDVLRAQLASPSERFAQEGDRLAAADRQAEAILAYRQAVERDARNVAALRKLARAYAGQGRRRLAQRFLRQALALEPGNAEIENDLASIVTLRAAPMEGALTLHWLTPVGEAAPVGLAVNNGVVYVTLESGLVQALDADTGAPRWQARLAKLTSPPSVASGMVWAGGQDGALYALGLSDGSQKWKFVTQAPIYAAVTVEADTVYCASGDGTLYALHRADGMLRWKVATGGPLHGQPTVADGVVYFGSGDGRLYAVEAATGAARWKDGVLTQGPVESQPTIADGRVFFGSGDSRLYSLAVAAGGEYWRYSTADGVYARPLVISDTVYVASAGQVLAALDVLSGEPRWELRTQTALKDAPAWAGDRLYFVAAGDPNLYAADRSTGRVLWQMDTGDWLASGPVVVNGVVYLAGKDGTVLAFSAAR